jgi:hypothetical protein
MSVPVLRNIQPMPINEIPKCRPTKATLFDGTEVELRVLCTPTQRQLVWVEVGHEDAMRRTVQHL